MMRDQFAVLQKGFAMMQGGIEEIQHSFSRCFKVCLA